MRTDGPRPWSLVVAASVPPPIAGQSLATVWLLRELTARAVPYSVLNLSRPFDPNRTLFHRMRRAGAVAQMPLSVLSSAARLRPAPRLLYLQLGQSPQALARDAGILSAAAALRMRTVLHVHGGGFRTGFEQSPRALRTAIAAFLRSASSVVALTDSLRAMFDGLVAPDKIAICSNGVEADLAKRALAHTPRRAGPLRALYLSNFMVTKGYLCVLEAAQKAQAQKLPIRFILAGAATEEMTVSPEAFVAAHGLRNVDVHGSVEGEAKLRLFENADAFVLPTQYRVEGQPISILEAMHFGLPVITCRMGGIPDVVKDEENGWLVPPENADRLLGALQGLNDSPDQHHAIAARNQSVARERYTEENHRKLLFQILSGAAAPR